MESTTEQFQSSLSVLYKKIEETPIRNISTLHDLKLRSSSHEHDNAKKGNKVITKSCMVHIITLMQHITDLAPPEKRHLLLEPVEEYDIGAESRFLDIGGEFSRAVFHVAMQVGCESKGIGARVQTAKEFLSKIIETKGNYIEEIKTTDNEVKELIERKRKKPETEEWPIPELLRKYKIIENEKKLCKKGIISWISIDRQKIPEQRPLGILVPEYKSDITKQIQKIEPKKKHKQLTTNYDLSVNYHKNWYEKVLFESIDMSKLDSYTNHKGEHYTHIYWSNKTMSKDNVKEVSAILNKTDYRVYACYLNENEIKKSGLKDFMLIHRIPVTSIAGDNLTIYIYIKTKSDETLNN